MTCWKIPHGKFTSMISPFISILFWDFPALFDSHTVDSYYVCPQWYATPPFPQKNLPFACYLQYLRVTGSHFHAFCNVFRATTFNLHPICSIESHMLPTYDIRAVHIVPSRIYMVRFYLAYLCTSRSVLIYYSSVAYD